MYSNLSSGRFIIYHIEVGLKWKHWRFYQLWNRANIYLKANADSQIIEQFEYKVARNKICFKNFTIFQTTLKNVRLCYRLSYLSFLAEHYGQIKTFCKFYKRLSNTQRPCRCSRKKETCELIFSNFKNIITIFKRLLHSLGPPYNWLCRKRSYDLELFHLWKLGVELNVSFVLLMMIAVPLSLAL